MICARCQRSHNDEQAAYHTPPCGWCGAEDHAGCSHDTAEPIAPPRRACVITGSGVCDRVMHQMPSCGAECQVGKDDTSDAPAV